MLFAQYIGFMSNVCLKLTFFFFNETSTSVLRKKITLFFKIKIIWQFFKTYILSILSSRAVADCQAATDEIILNIHHYEGSGWSGNLGWQTSPLFLIFILTFFIHSFQQNTNSCLDSLPVPLTLKMLSNSSTWSVSILMLINTLFCNGLLLDFSTL